jgi:hypothetical protein
VQVISRASTTGRLFRYGCGQYAGRGETVCGNKRLARLDQVDAEIRELLATEVLRPTVVEAALEMAIAMLTPKNGDQDNRSVISLRRQLRDVEQTLANLVETAAKGGAVPAVLEALNRADEERRRLERELVEMTVPVCRRSFDVGSLRRTLRGYLKDWHDMIRDNVAEARGLLTVVLRERITFTPKLGANGDPVCELKIPIVFDRLLVSVVPGLEAGFARVGLASPTGTALLGLAAKPPKLPWMLPLPA